MANGEQAETAHPALPRHYAWCLHAFAKAVQPTCCCAQDMVANYEKQVFESPEVACKPLGVVGAGGGGGSGRSKGQGAILTAVLPAECCSALGKRTKRGWMRLSVLVCAACQPTPSANCPVPRRHPTWLCTRACLTSFAARRATAWWPRWGGGGGGGGKRGCQGGTVAKAETGGGQGGGSGSAVGKRTGAGRLGARDRRDPRCTAALPGDAVLLRSSDPANSVHRVPALTVANPFSALLAVHPPACPRPGADVADPQAACGLAPRVVLRLRGRLRHAGAAGGGAHGRWGGGVMGGGGRGRWGGVGDHSVGGSVAPATSARTSLVA